MENRGKTSAIAWAVGAALALGSAGCIQPSTGLSFSQRSMVKLNASQPLLADQDEATFDLAFEQSIQKYGPIIRKYSEKYDLDWRLVLAVIRQESSFKPNAQSRKGAYGLMQIMPGTQAELMKKLGVPEARSPYYNIKAGMYHLKSLYRYFEDAPGRDRRDLALAAYNAGLSRIKDAQDIVTYLGGDPDAWQDVAPALKLLSSDNQTLHARVWPSGRPNGGTFKGSAETIGYVENIEEYYEGYRLLALR
jgi:membrane-bound lytic murein transglycosylase F